MSKLVEIKVITTNELGYRTIKTYKMPHKIKRLKRNVFPLRKWKFKNNLLYISTENNEVHIYNPQNRNILQIEIKYLPEINNRCIYKKGYDPHELGKEGWKRC